MKFDFGIDFDNILNRNPVVPWVAPLPGDLIFGAQGNMGYPTFSTRGGTTVATGYENTLLESYIPSQGDNWRIIFGNSYGYSAGASPVEENIPNTTNVAWSSLFTGLSGAGFVSDIPFTKFGNAMEAGGFTISEPLAGVSDGAVVRTVLNRALGAKRMSGRAVTVAAGTQNRRSATQATLDTSRVSGGVSGSTFFNLEAEPQPVGVVRPRLAGERSFLLIGTSIMRGEATDIVNMTVPRNAYGYLPLGLDSTTNGRMGWAQFAVYGTTIAWQDQNLAGEFGARMRILRALKNLNGGRDAFTDIILDFRNDCNGQNSTDAATTLELFLTQTRKGIAKVKAMFPGCPIHLVDLPPIQPMAAISPWYCTDLVNQVPAAGNYRSAATLLYNAYIAANLTELGIESVVPAGSAICAPDDGTGNAKWKQSEFNLSNPTLTSAVAVGRNYSTTGITVSATAPPEVGDYLVFEPGSASLEYRGAVIGSVVTAGTDLWLVKMVGNVTANTAHAAGSIIRTTKTPDLTHPTHGAQQIQMANAVVAWKASLPAIA